MFKSRLIHFLTFHPIQENGSEKRITKKKKTPDSQAIDIFFIFHKKGKKKA